MILQFFPRVGRPFVVACILAGVAAGCAQGTLGRVSETDDLPKDLSKDLQDKFHVTEIVGAATPGPVPSATPEVYQEPKVVKKKHKTSKKTPLAHVSPAPSVAVTVPFAFPNRRPPIDPLWVGEKATYDITYFGMSAGDFTLELLPYKAIDGRKVYHVRGNAVSSKVFSLLYRLNDMVETFIDFDGLFSHRFHIVLDETKQARDSLELYDAQKKQTFYWNRWNHKARGYSETKEFSPIEPFSQDSLSALYYLRTLPLVDGGVYSVPVVSEGKSWEAVVTVVRREEMRTPMGRVQCIVLKPETKYQGMLKKQGDSYLWLTDDDRRVAVRLEAKVRIGTVVSNLRKYEPGTPP
ncbi:DUF3108 domain-containing protein [Bdellovibrionota bacterium FG-1]